MVKRIVRPWDDHGGRWAPVPVPPYACSCEDIDGDDLDGGEEEEGRESDDEDVDIEHVCRPNQPPQQEEEPARVTGDRLPCSDARGHEVRRVDKRSSAHHPLDALLQMTSTTTFEERKSCKTVEYENEGKCHTHA